MKSYPLSLRTPAARAFARGEYTHVRRPISGMLRKVTAGDLLWIREPFRLKRKFGGISPTSAKGLGASPFFAADLNARLIELEELGPEQPARSLLKVWHRQHARVCAVEEVRLQTIPIKDVRAEGFGSISAWARSWDEAQEGFGTRANYWAENPTVLLLTLDRVAAPLPVTQQDPA